MFTDVGLIRPILLDEATNRKICVGSDGLLKNEKRYKSELGTNIINSNQFFGDQGLFDGYF